MSRITRLLMIGACLAPSLRAQQPPAFTDADRAQKVTATASTVAQMFREYGERQHMPGLAYGVLVDGNLVLSGGFGFANLDTQAPADTRSLFRIASMSKSFTALAILQLRMPAS